MTKANMTDYMRHELADLKGQYDAIQADYDKADHMGRIGLCVRLDKAQDKYYLVWMMCNDMGIIDPLS